MRSYNEDLIELIINSQCKIFNPEYNHVSWDNGIFTVYVELNDSLQERFGIKNRPDVVCLMVFMMLTAYVENKYSLQQGSSFKLIYDSIPQNNNIDKIVRGCFRLMKLMRNAYVHNSNEIVKTEHGYIFDYARSFRNNTTQFYLNIDDDTLGLLYALIIMLVREKSRIGTVGHYEELIAKYFTEIVDKVSNDLQDEMNDDINDFDRGIGLVKERRYIVKNARYELLDDKKLVIKKEYLYKTHYDWESVDYKIDYNSSSYVIPREILSNNNDIEVECLERWKLC